ncbi:YbaY family lipoprotein [Taklimakanibacter lacteus]|uniref:YbaY family lipoprotein n=1 Tax=Taklimakanibacter lacteus TaxID=2268456 RepID=UPI000E66B9DF
MLISIDWRHLALVLLVMWVTAGTTEAEAKRRTISGMISYRERIALPPSAMAEVKLIDISLADAPAKVIASTTVMPQGHVPFRYSLSFDDAQIESNHSYGLRAIIMVDGAQWFTTTTHYPVLADGKDEIDMTLRRTSGNSTGTGDQNRLSGRWLAEDIRGGGVIDRLQTVLEIAEDGKITGSGGCNRFTGRATIAGENFTIGPVASTNMACSPAIMDQEQKFFAALREVRTWKVDPTRRKLALLDADGRALIVLARM